MEVEQRGFDYLYEISKSKNEIKDQILFENQNQAELKIFFKKAHDDFTELKQNLTSDLKSRENILKGLEKQN